jgi:hypothetical protein
LHRVSQIRLGDSQILSVITLNLIYMSQNTEYKNTLRQVVAESELNLETRQEIERLLQDESLNISFVEQQVLMMVSQEIDQDMDDLGIPLDENDPELVAQRAEFEQGMDELQKEMEEDQVLISETFNYLGQQVTALV